MGAGAQEVGGGGGGGADGPGQEERGQEAEGAGGERGESRGEEDSLPELAFHGGLTIDRQQFVEWRAEDAWRRARLQVSCVLCMLGGVFAGVYRGCRLQV